MRYLALVLALVPLAVQAQEQQPPRCAEQPVYGMLDFWVGEWDVYAGDELVGVNRIEKALGGCAIFEHWVGAGGGKGKSLFYVDQTGRWQQVWVTEQATVPGGVKEKTLQDERPEGSLRFQGAIRTDEGAYLDRTTLTPQDDGTVRQLIEVSTDGGESWRAVFDAIYRPAGDDR